MSATQPAGPHFIANNLALDFINARFGVGDAEHDAFTDDRSVLAWLALAGVAPHGIKRAPNGLATQALALREAAAKLIDAAKTGRRADASVVNQLLAQGRSIRTLQWQAAAGRHALVEQPPDHSAASLLEPVAAAIARLLSEGDLDRVHQCEAHDCTLLFEDTTKSRRRRWCSMALCGNRMKVAAFRARRQA